jgi:PAS domain S-box-containing protein
MQAAPQPHRSSSEDEVAVARHAAILSALAEAILLVDADGRAVWANSAFEELFGATATQLVDFDPGTDQLRLRAARGETFTAEIELATPGGQRWFDARTAPVCMADGEVHGGVLILSERTDRRLLKLHEEFMAMASHELRSPLTALGGFFEMLARRLAPVLDERSRQHVDRGQAQIRRLFDLVNELTDLSRLHSGKLELKQQRLDLVSLVSQIVETGQTLSDSQRLELTAPDGPVMVKADSQRLEQVLMNLVGNAIKYAPEGDRIDVRLDIVDDSVIIRVQDYGQGIAEADRDQIFLRYFQARRRQPLPQAGLGLGLYIAREIMLAHGGDLELTSTSGDGSIFSARLPLLSS